MSTALFKDQKPKKILVKNLPEHLRSIFLNSIQEYDPNSDKAQIVADGLKSYPSPYRSPWFDLRNLDRLDDRRDFICNVCASPHGSADSPFDSGMLEEIRKKDIRPPDYEGELDGITFYSDTGQNRLKWWGTLVRGRPNQRHNYIIAVDPSYGLGSANSAIEIIDVNLGEQAGEWVDAYTDPADLADFVSDLAEWIGGVTYPFIMWECNAGCGTKFTDRIVSTNYPNLYTQRREDSKTRKKVKKWGWRSNSKEKERVIAQLSTALNNGLRQRNEPKLIIHSKELLDELSDYVFKEGGTGIVQSSRADLNTGAQERHGDRGIAMSLCVLGLKEQEKGDLVDIKTPPFGSFEYFKRQHEKQKEIDKRKRRKFIF